MLFILQKIEPLGTFYIEMRCLFVIFNVRRGTSYMSSRSSPTDETGGCRHACGCSIQNRLSPSLSACKRDARHNRARVTPPTTYVWFIRSNRCQRYAGSHVQTTGRWPVTRDRRLSFALTFHVDFRDFRDIKFRGRTCPRRRCIDFRIVVSLRGSSDFNHKNYQNFQTF